MKIDRVDWFDAAGWHHSSYTGPHAGFRANRRFEEVSYRLYRDGFAEGRVLWTRDGEYVRSSDTREELEDDAVVYGLLR